jgi:hypothetical protein
MAATFPPWANTATRVALAGLFTAGAALVIAPMIYVRMPSRRGQFDPVDQPVEFDHRHHAGDAAIECLYCHSTAERAATAGIPSADVCMGCHSQVWNRSLQLEPVRRAYFSGAPIPWNRVHDVPDFTFFDHSAHVTHGVGCVTCHGRVDQMARVHQVAPLTMGWCLDCHREPEKYLQPPETVTRMEWKPDEDQEKLGMRLSHELGVRRLTHCSACHR